MVVIKKFAFSLDSVLTYKQQALDALMGEHGAILAQVREQEAVVEAVKRHYAQQNQDFRDKKETGITISEAMLYETGLRVLEQDILLEEEELAKLMRREEEKREQVVEAKKDTSSLEKLKEKKLDGYHKALQKSEEALIDEFVSLKRVVGDGA